MKLLASYGLTPELKTIIVDPETLKWPAHSPDMNWLDEYVWGYMVSEMWFMRIRNKKELRKAIKKLWKTKITKKFCQDAITSFWKGRRSCGWWQDVTTCDCGGHGVLDQIIHVAGDRVKDFRIWDHGPDTNGSD